MKQNWVAVTGKVEISNTEIAFAPVPSARPDPTAEPSEPFAVVKSDAYFESGTISWEAKIEDSAARCQIGWGSQRISVFAGLNVGQAPYGFAAFRNNQWESLPAAGFGNTLPTQEWFKLRLKVQGSNLELFFNNVSVASASYSVPRGPVELLFSKGGATIRNIEIDPMAPVAFIVMQFTDAFNSLYLEVIKPTCESYGYSVIRADDIYTSGLIIDDITRSIREAAIIIADVTPNNLNVFYEVGYAHGIGKPTILLSDRTREKLPFDISGMRTLFYDNTIGGKGAVEERLKKHLDNVANRHTETPSGTAPATG